MTVTRSKEMVERAFRYRVSCDALKAITDNSPDLKWDWMNVAAATYKEMRPELTMRECKELAAAEYSIKMECAQQSVSDLIKGRYIYVRIKKNHRRELIPSPVYEWRRAALKVDMGNIPMGTSLTTRQVGLIFGVSHLKVAAWARNGYLPAPKRIAQGPLKGAWYDTKKLRSTVRKIKKEFGDGTEAL